MQQYDWYFKQPVTPAELSAAFLAAEQSIQGVVQGAGLFGLALNGAVSERAPTPLLSVTVTGPLVAYDETGNRILAPTNENVDVSVDENSASTTVSTGGQERYLSVFAKFERVVSDPRLDGEGETVFYSRAEGYRFVVAAGAPAPAGTASRPLLRAGHVLLADVKLVNGQTSIVNSDILTNRTQYVFSIADTPISLQARTIQEAMAAMLAAVNGAVAGTVSAAAVTSTPVGSVAATNVQAAIAELDGDAQSALAGVASVSAGLTGVTDGLNAVNAWIAAQLVGTHMADVASGFSRSTDWSLSTVSDVGFVPAFSGTVRQTWNIPIKPPHGSILISATARIVPSAVPEGANRMNVRVVRQAASGAPTTVNGAVATSPGGGDDDTITVTTSGHLVNTVDYAYRIVVESGVLEVGDTETILGAWFTTGAP